MVVGDAMARPLADAIGHHDADYDLSSVAVVGSGGAILSKAVREELRRLLPDALVMDSFGASETGHAGTVMDLEGGGPRFTMNDTTSVLDDDGRPVKPGSGQIGRLARSGHIPLGYYKDDEKTAATFLVDPDGEAVGDPRRLRDHRRGRHAQPARSWFGVHQHRRREGLSRGGRGRAEGAPRRVRRGRRRRARRAVPGAGRGRSSRRATARRRRSTTSRRSAARSSRATRFRGSCT